MTVADANHESIATRLYRGDVSVDFIGRRKVWYVGSGIVILVSIISLVVRGLTPSIDFKGGEQYSFSDVGKGYSISQVQNALSGLGYSQEDIVVVTVGSGKDKTIQVQVPLGKNGQVTNVNPAEKALSEKLGVEQKNITSAGFSGTWGSQITEKAILGLVIFLVFVSIYLAIRFEWKMAAAAMVALLHDLTVTAGIYSLVGFEVSPSTVIAVLTILGYSLYDTVVVFDKVRENTAGLLRANTMTFSEATNLAVNQTLVRSINTSVIALLPVIGLLVIGAGFFGAGSLDDLALALLIGLASGAYSSIFIASPLVTDFKEREPAFQALAKRVATRRERGSSVAKKAAAATTVPIGAAAVATASEAGSVTVSDNVVPRGPRPTRPGTQTRRHSSGGKPSRKRR